MMADFLFLLLQLLFEELPSGMAIGPQACASQMIQEILYRLMLLMILDW